MAFEERKCTGSLLQTLAISQSRSLSQFQLSIRAAPRWVPRSFGKVADGRQGRAKSSNNPIGFVVDLFAHLPLDEWREFTVGLLKSCISFRDTTADAPAWERCRSTELPWWKALTEGFTRCRFHVGTTDRKLEEVLAWFSRAMGPTMAALYCAAGPEWVAKVIESGSSRWKAPHYQLMKQKKPKRPYPLKAT